MVVRVIAVYAGGGQSAGVIRNERPRGRDGHSGTVQREYT